MERNESEKDAIKHENQFLFLLIYSFLIINYIELFTPYYKIKFKILFLRFLNVIIKFYIILLSYM